MYKSITLTCFAQLLDISSCLFALFKELLGAAVVLGHAWSHRHWLQDFCYPLEVSFSHAVLSHPGAAAPSLSITSSTYTSPLQNEAPALHPHHGLSPLGRGNRSSPGGAGSCMPMQWSGDGHLQGSAPLQALGSGLTACGETLTKVHRAVPACREVTASYLDAQAFFRVQLPHRSCPCSGQGRSGFEGAGLGGSTLHTQRRVAAGQDPWGRCRLGEVPSQRKVPHSFWLWCLCCKVLPWSTLPLVLHCLRSGRGVLYLDEMGGASGNFIK